jgi:hypothetical protein
MTETSRMTGAAWAEFSGEALESVEIVGIAGIESPCSAT